MTPTDGPQEQLLDRYLNELSWAMGGSFAEQQAARDELRAHIREASREHELAGLAPDEALAAALRDLGDPSDLGRSMRASRGTASLRRPLLQPEGALILEPRRIRHLPPAAVLIALAAFTASTLAIVLAYAWP